MTFKRLGVVLLLLSYNILLLAQVNDTTALPMVTVAVEAKSAEQVDLIDTTMIDITPHQHLGILLAQSSGVYLKNYGVSSIATTSIRGGSAGHTRVLWNDVPLESPMLGQFDFSLLPIIFVDNASVLNGSNTAYRGNGAIGGTLVLNNDNLKKNQGLGIQYIGTIGSFGLHQEALKIGFSNDKFGVSIRGFYKRAVNNYKYEISASLPKKEQTNGRFKQWGFLPEFYFQPNEKHRFTAKIWWLDTYRQIPPTTVQSRSVAFQKDFNKRFLLGWDYRGARFDMKAKTSWFDETLYYDDALSGVASRHSFNTWFSSIQSKLYLNDNHLLELGIQNTYHIAISAAYEKDQVQNRLANWANWRWNKDRLQFDLSARLEIQDDKLLPLVGGFGVDYKLSNLFNIYASVQRNYRSPYFNALYYQPGGNPDLLPERGWSEELGINFNKGNFNVKLTAYHRYIHNWIRWVLISDEIGNYYAPSNILAVRSSGIEQRFTGNWTFSDWKLKISQGYNLNRSVHQVPYTNPRIEEGEQLVYTPVHQVYGDAQLAYKQFYINYNYNWTDEVATLRSTMLPSYGLSNINLGGKIKFNQYSGHLSLGVLNVFDKTYRVIDRRAMPGRNYQLNLFIQLN